jgi:hypothetical protein
MYTAARKLLAALAIAAIGVQLRLHIAASFSVLNFFSYFTNLGNLFAIFALLFSAYSRSATHGGLRDAVSYVSAVNMAIVGLVFAVLLRNVDLGALLPWVNMVLHYVMPVAVVVDWLLQPPAAKLPRKYLSIALIFPAIYLIYVLTRGASIGWYPYPFLNPATVGGYSGVAMYSISIAGTFLLVGWMLLIIGNRRATAV